MYFWIVRVQTRRPSLSNSPRIRSAPHSRLSLAITLINSTVSVEIFGLGAAALDLYFQYSFNPWRCQREPRLWLNDEQRLLPGPYCSCQKDQEHPVGLLEDWSFDVSAEDDEWLAQKCIFCHEFGLASGKVCQRPSYESGIGWFGPVDEAVVERLKAHACQAHDEGENSMHSVRSPFVKMSR